MILGLHLQLILSLLPYLCASLEKKAFKSRAGTHQGLDAILGDLITPGDVELLQQGTTLTDRRELEKNS